VTSALVWWIAVLALPYGLVAVVRARSWSPAQDDPSELRTRNLAARLTLLPVVLLLLLAALGSLSLLGWSALSPGRDRFRDALPLLAVCAATGLGASAGLLTMVGRRVRSWWLLTGLLPAVAGTAMLLGV
jgi:hypothetical protein